MVFSLSFSCIGRAPFRACRRFGAPHSVKGSGEGVENRECRLRLMKYTTPDGDVIECTVSEYKELKAADKPADKKERHVALNQELAACFDAIDEYGPISRTDLAVMLERTPQQVSNLLQQLKVKGLVVGTKGHSTWELSAAADEGHLVARVLSA